MLTSQEMMALQRIKDNNTCAMCGGLLRLQLTYSRERGTEGEVKCWVNPNHVGYSRNPKPNRPLTYKEVKERGMLHWRRET